METKANIEEPIMPHKPSANAPAENELQSFEPLRVVLALGALLLGLLVGIH